MTDDRIAQIQARCDKATSGPWKLLKVFDRYPDGTPSCDIQAAWDDRYELRIASACRLHEADFLANAREDIPFLLATIAALSAEKERDQQLVFAIATETASELVKICGVNPSDDSARLNYLAELFAPDPQRKIGEALGLSGNLLIIPNGSETERAV